MALIRISRYVTHQNVTGIRPRYKECIEFISCLQLSRVEEWFATWQQFLITSHREPNKVALDFSILMNQVCSRDNDLKVSSYACSARSIFMILTVLCRFSSLYFISTVPAQTRSSETISLRHSRAFCYQPRATYWKQPLSTCSSRTGAQLC